MPLLISIILGLIQGLTEFIPVSSSGHLELAQQLIGGRSEDFHYFLELINFGTLLALIIYYRKRIKEILIDVFKKHDFRLAINIIITCIPAGLAGLLLNDFIEENPFFSSLWTIAIAIGVVGIIMILSDELPHLSRLKDENKLTRTRALGIGLSQICALIPGVSRSGSTILGGRMMGLNTESAANYSFLVSIPLMTAVCLKTLISSSARQYLMTNIGSLAIANIVAFASGLIAVNLVMDYFKKPGALKTFGYYRVCLSIVVIITLLINS